MKYPDRIAPWCLLGGAALIFISTAWFAASLNLIRRWWYAPVFVLTLLMGVAALSAFAFLNKRPRLARRLVWVSAAGLIPAVWVDPFTWGVFLLPALAALLLAWAGLRQKAPAVP